MTGRIDRPEICLGWPAKMPESPEARLWNCTRPSTGWNGSDSRFGILWMTDPLRGSKVLTLWRSCPDRRVGVTPLESPRGGPPATAILRSMPLPAIDGPRILGTWSFSIPALEGAWPHLASAAGERPILDAMEAACACADLDPNVDSVGFGGLPDASGRMSLDGAVMLSPARFGGVCGLRRHLHPAAVARLTFSSTTRGRESTTTSAKPRPTWPTPTIASTPISTRRSG